MVVMERNPGVKWLNESTGGKLMTVTKNQIIKAIREILVVSNAVSIPLAADKIIKLIEGSKPQS